MVVYKYRQEEISLIARNIKPLNIRCHVKNHMNINPFKYRRLSFANVNWNENDKAPFQELLSKNKNQRSKAHQFNWKWHLLILRICVKLMTPQISKTRCNRNRLFYSHNSNNKNELFYFFCSCHQANLWWIKIQFFFWKNENNEKILKWECEERMNNSRKKKMSLGLSENTDLEMDQRSRWSKTILNMSLTHCVLWHCAFD